MIRPPILFTNCSHTFILNPEPHLPSPIEVISHRKRRREVEGAEEGVKRIKEDEEQHQSNRGKAVGTFAVAGGVYKLMWCRW